MIKVGITGAMGSGKSTVCRLFNQLYDIPIYDADKRAKYLMSFDQKLKTSIKALLGNKAYHKNGRLNRSFVAKKIFNDKKLIKQINHLVHPVVYEDSNSWFEGLPKKMKYGIKEAALLFESDSHKQLDVIIVVEAPDKVRIERILKRDKTDIQSIKARMKNQWSQEKKIKMADYVIHNLDKDSLVDQIKKLHKTLCAIKSRS